MGLQFGYKFKIIFIVFSYIYDSWEEEATISSCETQPQLNNEQIHILLKAHNAVRASATPQPMISLRPITWHEGLASRAQELANSCRFAHVLLNDCSGQRMGQNLAWYGSSYTTLKDNITGHVARWAEESDKYDLTSGRCAGICGHYTQIVWEDTTMLGCGYQTCKRLYNADGSLQRDMGEGSAWYLVCNYSPAGNIRGQKPYISANEKLVDKNHHDCLHWISQYCTHTKYGAWARSMCAHTCRYA